jgi:hypothetical protein
MKTLLLFVGIFILNSSFSQTKTINTVTIGNLEIMTEDILVEPNTWRTLTKASLEIGGGWRLPTIDELSVLYTNRDLIGGFDKYCYWSSTEFPNSADQDAVFYIMFNAHNGEDGKQVGCLKTERAWVRHVRLTK